MSKPTVGLNITKPEDIKEFPIFPPEAHSLMFKYLTKEVWDLLKDAKDAHGYTLRQLIFCGCRFMQSNIGVYAGSPDSYKCFAPLLNPMLEEYHHYKRDAVHTSDMDPSHLAGLDDPDPTNEYVISSRIRVARNLADFPLPAGTSNPADRAKIESLIVKACTEAFKGTELEGKYYSLPKMTEEENKFLVENHFLFESHDEVLHDSGLAQDWPNNRGIFHNTNKTFLIWVNEEDEMRIISMQPGGDIQAVFARLSQAVGIIEKFAKFAHDPHLGYISSCPSNLGTGMRASVHVKLPKIGKDLAKLKEIAKTLDVQIRMTGGEKDKENRGVYDVSNLHRLGYSEVELTKTMHSAVKTLIAMEKKA